MECNIVWFLSCRRIARVYVFLQLFTWFIDAEQSFTLQFKATVASWSMNMHTPKYDPETYHPQQSYSAKQLSRYDMEVAGVVVYVVAMTVFFVVALVMMLFGNETVNQAQAHAANVEHHAPAPQTHNAADLAQVRVKANR